jgi:putative DNA primase/helicase
LCIRAFSAIDELAGWAHWVTWRSEFRDGKPTKVPYDPATGQRASVTDPTTWSSFDTAVTAYHDAGFTGVGFVLTSADPYAGLDLDGCRDSLTGIVEPWAQSTIDLVGSYTEVSPSGSGLRVFLHGVMPGPRCRHGSTEVYGDLRYLTVTGQHVAGTPTTIEDRQPQLERLYQELFSTETRVAVAPDPKRRAVTVPTPDGGPVAARRFGRTGATPMPPMTDDELLRRARDASNGWKFEQLFDAGAWQGDYPSQSEADLALCGLLVFWTRDANQVDRLFRQSALMRFKWDEMRGRGTYGQQTVQTALDRR